MADVKIEGITKRFTAGVVAVNNVTLEIPDGKFVILVGPSGCGKTTLLRLIAGLESVSCGTIKIGGQDVTRARPRDRDIAMVFQSYALYPHMTVRRNMSFALELKGLSEAEIGRRIKRTSEILGIGGLLDRQPKHLSGGQRQRVALGRAIVREPSVFLFDEPLSNLDAKLRTTMRSELIKLHNRLKTTVVYVTHDQVEAMTMGQLVVVMKDGVIQQTGEPLEIYHNPHNRFVAEFIGSPSMNFLSGKLRVTLESTEVVDAVLKVGWTRSVSMLLGESGVNVHLGIRPEHLSLGDVAGNTERVSVEGTVEVVEPLGAETIIEINCSGTTLVARVPGEELPKIGQKVMLSADVKRFFVFNAQTGERINFVEPHA